MPRRTRTELEPQPDSEDAMEHIPDDLQRQMSELSRGLISMPARYSIVGWCAKDGKVTRVTLALSHYVELTGDEWRAALARTTQPS